MNIGMLSGKGKDVPECVYEFAFPTAHSYMRPGNKPLFRGSIKNHNPRKGTETANIFFSSLLSLLVLKIIIPVRGRKQDLTPLVLFSFTCCTLKIIIPVRGRKLDSFNNYLFVISGGIIKNHNPRKGTETICYNDL